MKLARHRKARTAAITDATLSEVAKLAQIKLYYSSNSPAYVRSHTALLSLIQALAYGVYARDSAQYDDRIKAFGLKEGRAACGMAEAAHVRPRRPVACTDLHIRRQVHAPTGID